MGKQWYALNTKPHKELMVYSWLLSRDVDAYLPLLDVQPKNPRSRKKQPWFPGYLFVEVNLVEFGTDALRYIPGAKQLVGTSDEPIPIQASVIRRLADRLDQINFAPAPTYDFESGDEVKVISGPLEGYAGIFDQHLQSADRVQILLQLIQNQPKIVHLHPNQIHRIE